ncbi:MAG: GAF domain-containing protein [Acidobacteria bacterium]|nr:GAF domain-containing protein [Acidobacteriota bacterium]MBV9478768.1 GAF domain-containing protein [Acidobacteriota bacterium]
MADRIAALSRVSELLQSGGTAREAMQRALDVLPEILPADAYALWHHDYHTEEWRVTVMRGLSPTYGQRTLQSTGTEEVILRNPFFVHDVFASTLLTKELHAFYRSEGIRSLLVIPLHVRGGASGTLACYYRTPHEAGEADLPLARVLGHIVSSALATPRFERFAEAARAVAAELDLHRLVQTVTDAATELTNAQFGAFFYNVLDEERGSYTLYTISGVPREAFSQFPMPRNTDVFAPTFDGTGIVRSANIRNDPRYGHNAPYHGMPKGHLPVVSYLAVPVISRTGEVLGGLFFGHSDEGVFTENEEQVAAALAAQTAVGIDNVRLYDALNHERQLLARGEARYRSLVLAAPTDQIVWVTTPEGEMKTDLAEWSALTGQPPAEAQGLSWTEAVHPQDRALAAAVWQQALETRKPFSAQYRIRTRDDSYRWFAVTGVPVIGPHGVMLEWVGTIIDIHERKTADDSLRFLATASDLLASSLDYETTLKNVAQLAVPEMADWCTVDIVDDEASDTYRRLAVAHADPAKVQLAHELQERYPPDRERDAIANAIRTGESMLGKHIPPELLDAAARDDEHRRIIRELGLLSYIVVPLRTRERVVGALSFISSSESRRRYNESDLRVAEELARRAAVAIENSRLYGAAQAANRAKDDFLATLSHELRTPMTAVLGWSRMLHMGLGPEETLQAVDAIEKSATVQMQLIEDILDMSRIMAGKMRIETSPVDLRGVAEAALSTVAPAAAAKSIEILTNFDPRTPMVLGDPARLQQVVWNLLANAVKFTDRGGSVVVKITSRGNEVVLSVRDNGAGIDPAFLPHVFERFRQQDSSTTRAHGGIGLGLAIVRHLVELHGGRIEANSPGMGFGATFTLELPALARGTQAVVAAAHAGALPSLTGTSLLVVDDEELTRDVVAAILRRAGANVTTAESAREGLRAVDAVRPDVIVCDIAMPDEDGYAFVRALRGRDGVSGIPVIALTAFGRPEDRERALSSGFDAYLKKPVDPAVLAAAVREATAR